MAFPGHCVPFIVLNDSERFNCDFVARNHSYLKTSKKLSNITRKFLGVV